MTGAKRRWPQWNVVLQAAVALTAGIIMAIILRPKANAPIISRKLVPWPDESSLKLSKEAIQIYTVEYQQCMDSYRHTYATIWQAGAIFAAISGAVIAFSAKANSNIGSSGIPPIVQVIAPIPVLFWYFGIYGRATLTGESR